MRSRRSRTEKSWIDRSNFSGKEGMHAEQQSLQGRALKLLKRNTLQHQHLHDNIQPNLNNDIVVHII